MTLWHKETFIFQYQIKRKSVLTRHQRPCGIRLGGISQVISAWYLSLIWGWKLLFLDVLALPCSIVAKRGAKHHCAAAPSQWPCHDLLDLWHQRPRTPPVSLLQNLALWMLWQSFAIGGSDGMDMCSVPRPLSNISQAFRFSALEGEEGISQKSEILFDNTNHHHTEKSYSIPSNIYTLFNIHG